MAVILCIDDSDVGLIVRKLLLEQQGHKVITAITAEEGFQFFQEEPVELVISDHCLKGQTGTEIAVAMKALKPHVPFILLSGNLEPLERIPHVDLFITKGGKAESFVEKVSEVLERARNREVVE